jgi:hypothetical protein
MNADVSILKWNNISIDLNDKRLCNYVIYVDYFNHLCILNKQTFNLIKFSQIKDENNRDFYCMYNSKDEKMSSFIDINTILEQFWNN